MTDSDTQTDNKDDPLLSGRRQASLDRVRRWAWIFDDAVSIPGTRFRLGLDAVIGLIPGIGDAAGLAISAVPIAEAARLKAPRPVLKKMALNAATDFFVGLVPVIGDVADVAWRSNRRNLLLLEKWLDEELRPADTQDGSSIWLAIGLIGASLVGLVLLALLF